MKKIFAALAIMVATVSLASAAGVRRPEDAPAISKKTIEAAQAGDTAMNEKNYAKAVEEYTVAVDSGELSGDTLGVILVNRGVAYVNLQQCPKAIPDFTGAIEVLSTPNANAYVGRGQCYIDTGKAAEGVADFKQAVALAPTESSFVGAFCTAAFNAKIYAEAGPACEAYSAFVPTNAQIFEASAVSYQNAGNKAKALEMWKRLLALDPNSAVAKQGIQQNS